MNPDDENPATWSIRRLLQYCSEHHLSILSGIEREELVACVVGHQTAQRASEPPIEAFAALLSTKPQEVLGVTVKPTYTMWLRQHPELLRRVIEVGLSQYYTQAIESPAGARVLPAIGRWLLGVLDGEDDGVSTKNILTAPCAAAVCGRFFDDHMLIAHCHDCAVDTTCVMCMDCFLDSPCRTHNYVLHHGTSGGMCDCGDTSAWRVNNSCTRHGGYGADPTVGSPAQTSPWLPVAIDGLVQLLATALLTLLPKPMQAVCNVGAAGGDSANESNVSLRETAAEGAASPDASEDDHNHDESSHDHESSDHDAAAFHMEEASFFDYEHFAEVLRWLRPIAFQLEEFTSRDWCRRLLTQSWTVPTVVSSAAFAADPRRNCSCLEVFFLYGLHTDQLRRTNPKRWSVGLKAVSKGLCDPVFRIPFMALFMTYAERLQLRETELNNLHVQVFSCVPTLQTLTLEPERMPYAGKHTDTIAHRQLSAILYAFCHNRPVGRRDCKISHWSATPRPKWWFKIQDNTRWLAVPPMMQLAHMFFRCKTLGLVAVLSRTFWRGWFLVLLLLATNATIRKNARNLTNVIPMTEWVGLIALGAMQPLRERIRDAFAGVQTCNADEAIPHVLSERICHLAAQSRQFDPPPDVHVRGPLYERILQALALPDELAASLLPNEPHPTAQAYLFHLLGELYRALDTFLTFQFACLCGGQKTVVLSRPGRPIFAYDLLEPVSAGMTLTLLPQRFLAVLMHAWLDYTDAVRRTAAARAAVQAAASNEEATSREKAVANRKEGGNCKAEAQVRAAAIRLHGAVDANGARPLKVLLGQLLSLAERTPRPCGFVESLLDSLVMPFVLLAQKEEGRWRRNDANAEGRIQRYLDHVTNAALLEDVFEMQTLATRIPAEDFALQILQRFSYDLANPHRYGDEADEQPGEARAGLAGYFRLLLTLVQDTSKSAPAGADPQEAFARLVACYLAEERTTHSKLEARLESHFSHSSVEWSDHMSGPLSQTLARLAATEDSATGKLFRIQNGTTWAAWVDLYHPFYRDLQMPELLKQYRHVLLRERVQANGVPSPASASTGEKNSSPVMLPPTRLREAEEQHAELVPALRALLHTDALLLPACDVILSAAAQLQPRKGSANLSPNPTPVKNTPREATTPPVVCLREDLLLHAITVLYLCVSDCATLSRAMTAAAELDATPPTSSWHDGIHWEAVEAQIERERTHPLSSFGVEEQVRLLPRPELRGAPSIRALLTRPTQTKRADAWGTGLPTLAAALHALHAYFHANPERDAYSFRVMIRYILDETGVAPLNWSQPSCVHDRAVDAAGKSHEQQIRERQARLLRRLQSRSAKVCAEMEVANPTTAAGGDDYASPSPEASSAASFPTLTPSDPGYVHSRLLLELTTLECSICRVPRPEPLCFLAHSSTSGVLHHLGAGLLPEARRVHANFYLCGHAVHVTCTHELFRKLQRLWQGAQYFQGFEYLGAAEFSCPICLMVCTSLSPVPVLSPVSVPGRPLFEELQRGTQEGACAHQPILTDLSRTLAGAAIGAALSLDEGPLVEPPTVVFAQARAEVWELAEALRAVPLSLRTALEAVQAGVLTLGVRELRMWLSLLLAIPIAPECGEARTKSEDPRSPAVDLTEVRAGLTRSPTDALALLVLDVLSTPSEAARRIHAHALQLFATAPQACMIADALLLEVTTTRDEEKSSRLTTVDVMPLWIELGILVLLKLLVLASPAADVLGVQPPDRLRLGALDAAALESPGSRAEALLQLWGFLADVPTSEAAPNWAAALNSSKVLPPASPIPFSARPNDTPRFINSTQWRQHLLEDRLHLPQEYLELLAAHTRAVQHAHAPTPAVLCLYCASYLPFGRASEQQERLFHHARSCAGGVGLFLHLQYCTMIVLDAVGGRTAKYGALYTDCYGEVDPYLRRGARLVRNEGLCQVFLRLWIRNEWSTHSGFLTKCFRTDARQ